VCSQNAALQSEVSRLLEQQVLRRDPAVPSAATGDGSQGHAGDPTDRQAQERLSNSELKPFWSCLSPARGAREEHEFECSLPSPPKAMRMASTEEIEIAVNAAPTCVQHACEARRNSNNDVWQVVASAPLPVLPKRWESAHDASPRRSWQVQSAQLQGAWCDSESSQSISPRLSRSFTSRSKKFAAQDIIRGGDAVTEKNCLQRFVVSPSSRTRVVWDALSLLVLFYDILTVPLVSFNLPESVVLEAMDLCCTCFWTLDVPASLFTGYHDAGILEMRPSKIARSYLRSWFAFDFLVILLDWLMIATESGMADVIGLFRMSKAVRMVRIFRLFRLLRLLKMPALMDEVSDYIQSEHLFTAFGVMRSLSIIAIINHFIACGWYAVGTLGNEMSWVHQLDEDNRSLAYRYVTSLHWSLTQFTPSSMEIHPRNVIERVFSICVLFTALVIFSSFVSSITNAMTQLHQSNRKKGKQREDIRKYISENKLSLDLGNRIVAFGRKHNPTSRKHVHEDEIQILKVMPESLRLQLHWEVYLPVLTPHPFFFNCNESDEGCMLDICHNAMSEMSLPSGQELFTAGQTASKMFFVMSGNLEYYLECSDTEAALVSRGDWCVEVALWIKWVHEGRLAAVPHCELITLDGSTFRKHFAHRPAMNQIGQEYAKLFKKEIVSGQLKVPVEIWTDFDKLTELAQKAFMKDEPEEEGTRPKGKWRPWRSMSLRRATKQAVKVQKSHSM